MAEAPPEPPPRRKTPSTRRGEWGSVEWAADDVAAIRGFGRRWLNRVGDRPVYGFTTITTRSPLGAFLVYNGRKIL